MRRHWRGLACTGFLAGVLLAGGCAMGVPKDALELQPDTLERRQLQSRRFDGTDEKSVLQASAGVLQDIGFNLDESETELGLIVGSKERSAVEAGQVVLAILAAAFGGPGTFDKTQRIRVSLVVRPVDLDVPAAQSKDFVVRVTFQRIIWNTAQQITRIEAIDEPEIYQEFYAKLSKSLFLEAQQL